MSQSNALPQKRPTLKIRAWHLAVLAALALLSVPLVNGARAESWNTEGKRMSDARDKRGAIQAFAQAVRLRPSEPRYRFNLATALARAGLFDQAVMELETIIRKDPGDSEASRVLSIVNRQIQARQAGYLADELR